MADPSSPVGIPDVEDTTAIALIATRISVARTKGELGQILAEEIGRYTIRDLQVIGGRLHTEMIQLPKSYRTQISPYLTEQLFGGHHQLLTLHRSGGFIHMTQPITDHEAFTRFCNIIPLGCTQWDEAVSRLPIPYTLRHRLFYYLIAAFTMFVLDHPGHPVGMPFPGGFKVEEQNGEYYCLIRDHEKEVPFSICNFCPAHQNLDHQPGSS